MNELDDKTKMILKITFWAFLSDYFVEVRFNIYWLQENLEMTVTIGNRCLHHLEYICEWLKRSRIIVKDQDFLQASPFAGKETMDKVWMEPTKLLSVIKIKKNNLQRSKRGSLQLQLWSCCVKFLSKFKWHML